MSKSRAERLKNEILAGPILKTLFMLGWPVMLSNGFQILYNLADTYWLGKIGKTAVAAPTVGFPIVFLLISVGFGFSIAGVSLVSQHTGAGSEQQADRAAGQVIGFMLVSSLFILIIGFFISPSLLGRLMSVPKQVYPKALIYIQIIFAGLPFMFIFFAFRSLIRGIGDMITPMIVTGLSVVVNLVLDPILIFGWMGLPELGVAGAAVATVLSRGLASIVAIYLLLSGKLGIHLHLRYFLLKLRWIKQIIKIGGPSSIGQAGTALGAIILMGLISRLGVVTVSAYGVGQRIIMMLNVCVWGVASPLTTMIGQNIGAEQFGRSELIAKKALITLFGILISLGTLLFFLRKPIFKIFISEPAVVKAGTTFLAIFVWSIPFFGFFALVSAVFRGSGHTRPPMILSLVRLLAFRVGLSYFLAFGAWIGVNLGARGIWWGLSLSNFLAGLLSLAWFTIGDWEKPTIEQEQGEEELEEIEEVAPV